MHRPAENADNRREERTALLVDGIHTIRAMIRCCRYNGRDASSCITAAYFKEVRPDG